MNIEFNNYVSELIEYSKGKQDGEKEIVSYDQALRACYYIFHIVPRKIGDLLLYCSSLSLMNSYVKQQDGAFYRKYSFKNNGLNRLMELLKNYHSLMALR